MINLSDKELKLIIRVLKGTASTDTLVLADKIQRWMWNRSKAISAADRRLIDEAIAAGKVQQVGVNLSGIPEDPKIIQRREQLQWTRSASSKSGDQILSELGI